MLQAFLTSYNHELPRTHLFLRRRQKHHRTEQSHTWHKTLKSFLQTQLKLRRPRRRRKGSVQTGNLMETNLLLRPQKTCSCRQIALLQPQSSQLLNNHPWLHTTLMLQQQQQQHQWNCWTQ